MEASILTSTKKILGLGAEYEAFDLDVLTHINAALSTLDQLGIGPEGGFTVEDNQAVWDNLALAPNQRNLVRTYIFLKVRMLFDPPQTSFLIEAMNKQIAELEWRMSVNRELLVAPLVLPEEEVV